MFLPAKYKLQGNRSTMNKRKLLLMSLLFFLSSHSSVLPEDKSYTQKVLISALSLFIISESEQACLGIFTPFPADAIVS